MIKIRNFIFITILIFCVIGCSNSSNNEEKEILLYAHQGYTQEAPSCSKPAWKAAKDKGYYGIELDVYSTTDNVFVVFHDKNIEELTNGNGNITDYSWDELQNISYDTGANIDRYPNLHISRIEELFEFVKENKIHLLLDIKTIHSYEDLTKMIIDDDIEDLCIIATNNPENLDKIRSISKKVGLRYWASNDPYNQIDIASSYNNCDVSFYREIITKELVNYAHSKGVKIAAFSIDRNPEPDSEYERLKDLDIDSATINTLKTKDMK